jgi:regulator of sigma E protease
LHTILGYLQVIVGLGVVIFVHELGHFLLAKWNGVKVEKFSIGFGTPLIAWRRGVGFRFLSSIPIPEPAQVGASESSPSRAPVVGETEYALAMIPLGGFVKMLGESIDEETSRTTDPRAYPNKSVGARMSIISAGVIMNVIFALACFAWIYGRGVKERTAVIGSVAPGTPAYLAGLRPGDEILAIGSKRPVNFDDLRIRSALSGHGEALRLEMKRPGLDQPFVVLVEPRTEPGVPLPRVGLGSSNSLVLGDPPSIKLPGMADLDPKPELHPGEMVVGVGPVDGTIQPVLDWIELNRWLTLMRASSIRLELRPANAEVTSFGPTRSVVLPANPKLETGLRMEIGPIDSVRKDSPAEAAGFRAGDRIESIDRRTDLDPMSLPLEIADLGGRKIEVAVRRPLAGNPRGQLVTLMVAPELEPTDTGKVQSPLDEIEPIDVPSLGLCYRVEPKVVAVEEGSPAEEAGIKPGAVLKGARVTFASPDRKPKKFAFEGKDAVSWTYLYRILQVNRVDKLELFVGDEGTPVTVVPRPSAVHFDPDRGLIFRPLERDLPPQGVLSAIKMGIDDVTYNGLSVLLMIRGIFQQRLSREVVSGPIGMVQMGGALAREDWVAFVRFLAQISMSLAVINFLPIPPLDGGQMVFLLAEKVRGRPLPESALAPVTWAGLIMLLALMVLVMFQDIYRLVIDYISWPF